MGGEKIASWTVCSASMGSPPRGRGKARRCCFFFRGFGITPAWAGKSLSVAKGCVTYRDHPRVGGEKQTVPDAITGSRGSPPRGRGKGRSCRCSGSGQGITPAWAGKSDHIWVISVPRVDHPRVGGEKSISAPSAGPGTGSPPRGRGKAFQQLVVHAVDGITPAWAGKRKESQYFIARR